VKGTLFGEKDILALGDSVLFSFKGREVEICPSPKKMNLPGRLNGFSTANSNLPGRGNRSTVAGMGQAIKATRRVQA